VDGAGRDEAKLNQFIAKSGCAEAKLRAQSVVASLGAEREQAQRACDAEAKQLATLLKAPGLEARNKLLELQSSLSCPTLSSKVVDALGKVNLEIRRELVRNAQAELRRLGCYRGSEDGEFNDSTKAALQRAVLASGSAEEAKEINDAVLANLKKLEGPLCSPPKTVPEEKPIATKPTKSPKTSQRPGNSDRENRRVRDERPAAAPSVRAESRPSAAPATVAPRSSGGNTMLGVGF
jgi:hypothetical protein